MESFRRSPATKRAQLGFKPRTMKLQVYTVEQTVPAVEIYALVGKIRHVQSLHIRWHK